jgi:hypothetical protein
MLTSTPVCVAADTDNFRVRVVSASTQNIQSIPDIVRAYDVFAGRNGKVHFGSGGTVHTFNAASFTTTSRQLVSLVDGAVDFLDAQLVSLAINPVDGLLYVAFESDPADVTASSGGALYSINLTSAAPAVLAASFPDWNIAQKIAFNGAGDAFITTITPRIYKWSGFGPPAPWNTGSGTAQPGADATNVNFGITAGIDIDDAGNMLISESDTCRVWLVDASTRRLKLVAGMLGAVCGSSVNAGDPTQTQLDRRLGVAFGPGGRSAFIAGDLHAEVSERPIVAFTKGRNLGSFLVKASH